MLQTNHKTQKGFALLITLLTVGVVVSATLAIVELSRMQLQLSVDSRDAEIAFSAANAAKECAQYIRNSESATIFDGARINSGCLEQNFSADAIPLGVASSVNGSSRLRRYQYRIDWTDSGLARCSEINMIVVFAIDGIPTIGSGGNNSLKRIISNYRNDSMSCEAGSECTIIAAAGYNSTCGNRNTQGVLKREVLLEF